MKRKVTAALARQARYTGTHGPGACLAGATATKKVRSNEARSA